MFTLANRIPMVTDKELETLLKEQESDLIERKRSLGDGQSIRQNICAFANDLPNRGQLGILLIGVEDNGNCAGLAITDELLSTLSQMSSDGSLMPIPTTIVERKCLNECDVAVVTVHPSQSPPVRFKGRAYVRVGPTVRTTTPEEERMLSERRRSADLPFDMRPAAGATPQDLDTEYVRTHYLPNAIAPDVLEGNRRTLEEQMRSLRLLREHIPTWGALLGFGIDPQGWLPGAYVQFLRIDGIRLTDPIRDQKTLTGRLEDVLRRLDELLELGITVRTKVAGTKREIRKPDYPLVALQQLTRNAVMHRLYEGTNTPVRVHWYDDRIEIQNPGGLYGQVNERNFGEGATDYRNPLVAEIMHHLGYAQRFGLGIPLAKKELSKNGNLSPEFDFQHNQFVVSVRRSV
jgi:ATP-dependent DNA helicase RecG